MGDSRIKDVSSLLSSFFDEEKLRRGERYSDFFSSWSAFVGARLAAHSRIVDVDKGILVVEADHPGWIQLLQMRQSDVLASVAQRFPELGLRGIVFRVTGQDGTARLRGIDSKSDGGAAEKVEAIAAETVPSSVDAEELRDEANRTGQIDDPEFRKLFDSLKRTMRGKD
jgi:hypothetical protein